MKYLKMLGLAVVAAMALMAFLGASTASATVLCKTTPEGGICPGEWDYPTGTQIDADLEGSAILETLGGTTLDTCTTGTVKAHTTNTGSTTETVEAKITEISWGTVATPCTKPTTTIKMGHLIIHTDVEDDHHGILTATESEVTVFTIFGTCTYGTGAALKLGTLTHSGAGGTGNEHATLDINAIVVKTAGVATCPAEARWTANYTVTEPKPLYVATGTV